MFVVTTFRCLCGLTCVQDVWQDGNYTQLTVLTGLLNDVFIEDLRDEHLQYTYM